MTHFQRVMSKMCVFIHIDVTRINQCDGVLFFFCSLCNDLMMFRHVCSCSVGSVGTFNLVFQEILALKAPGQFCSHQTESRSTHDRCESGRVMQSHHMVSR